ncbi:D-alanyl-D-alanine carboxypeptidase family protein [Paenibacillus ginsengarvi]|uniref:serine-type D-Ala-D-Ala carboxypeptidase n=1 Tax=Paenibacillus ginsengarvi TaxID=400777 RepID=A0A3B0AUN6_9BACL|nr:D-alanyl-D-alanine carboxypeptidase family protein [Paenibacillus ginsengarvi]RKN64201.1 D-alanyl-D-alanine carboxypeptidase [Paenibacillus ginsengarvi]
MAAIVGVQLFIHSPEPVQANEATDLTLDVKSAVLMDAESGQILFELNADTALPPASMTKMMTEYIVMEHIKSGKLKWDDPVTTSKYASEVPGSGVLLANGEQLSVRKMFQAMSIYSANDASVALAERIGGTEEDFTKLMNEKAKKLGMTAAHFATATGLNRNDLKDLSGAPVFDAEGETVMSAKDAAMLAYRILKDHPEVLEYAKIPSLKLRERDKSPMINKNWMLDGNGTAASFKKYAYPGLDGLKTGYTDEAGYCFTGTAVRNGMRLISVVMGTRTEPKRFEETRKLLDYGFNNFELRKVVAAKSEIDSMKSVELRKGVRTAVPVVTESGLTLVVKKGTTAEQFVHKTERIDQDKRIAPIKQGDEMGTLMVTYNGKDHIIKMVAAEDVGRGSWIRLLFRSIKNFHVGLYKGIVRLFG